MIYKNTLSSLLLTVTTLFAMPVMAQQSPDNSPADSAGCYSVANAAFDTSTNGMIGGWTGSSWGGSQASHTIDSPGYNSANAARMSMLVFAAGTSAKLRSDAIAVASDTNLSISFHARGDASVVQLQAVQLNANRAVLDYTWLNSVSLNANQSVWNDYQNTLLTLSDTAFIQLEIVLKSPGTVYFDELRAGAGSRLDSCTPTSASGTARSTTSNTGAARSPASLTNAELAQGVVFSRTDKPEYRWVQSNGSARVGNQWISQSCATQLNALVVEGTWSELNAIAPQFDSIPDPCAANQQSNSSQPTNDPLRKEIRLTPNGFVFNRTDKSETRWVDATESGEFSSQWISETCAKRLGAVQQIFGIWADLVALAPSMAGVRAPC